MSNANPATSLPLPFVDEHSVVVRAPAEEVWDRLIQMLEREFQGPAAERFARIVGCDHAAPSGPVQQGSEVVGFRVSDFEPARRLVLEGRHRFSDYRLTFELDKARDGDGTAVRAITHAAFPGLGRIYRALVVGTGGHALVVRRMLRKVARQTGLPPSS